MGNENWLIWIYSCLPQSVRPWLVWVYRWYTTVKVQFKLVLTNLAYWFGLYAPLWVITFLVGYWNMNKNSLTIENNDGDIIPVQISHVEYVVKERFESREQISTAEQTDRRCPDITQYYNYHITDRSVWYLYCIGDSYNEFMEYARDCLSWDLKEQLFDDADNKVVFKYIKCDDPDNFPYPQVCSLTLLKNDTYQSIIDSEITSGNIMYNTIEFK